MSRGLSSGVAAASVAEVVLRTVAVDLDFPSGAVRLNGSPADLEWGGLTFLGVGGLGAISVVEEAAELRAYDLTLQLSGIPRDMVALALTEQYQRRTGTVWEVIFDRTTHLPITDPVVIFRGRMDQMAVTLGDMATIQVTLQNRLADWETPRILRYTHEDQQRLHPDDLGLRFVSDTVQKQLFWPVAAWWEKR